MARLRAVPTDSAVLPASSLAASSLGLISSHCFSSRAHSSFASAFARCSLTRSWSRCCLRCSAAFVICSFASAMLLPPLFHFSQSAVTVFEWRPYAAPHRGARRQGRRNASGCDGRCRRRDALGCVGVVFPAGRRAAWSHSVVLRFDLLGFGLVILGVF